MDTPIAAVARLGDARLPSPLVDAGACDAFVRASEFIPLHITADLEEPRQGNLLFEKAGPRREIYFDPATTTAAIVTCGGLCPGLNNVIRSLVLSLEGHYGVRQVLGFRYGYHGLNSEHGFEPVVLTTDLVSDIHETGGTILGTSRGPEDPATIVEALRRHGVSILFPIGGDGTQRGAWKIHQEAVRQGYPLAVVGIPKTIDNDIQYVSRTFGFSTAVDAARNVIDVAHTEARAVLNGVGLVKLMGRDSGFIAAGATLASGEVNYCLIPELPVLLEGERGLFHVLAQRLARKRHAVIVAAEGAGQALIAGAEAVRDASGNLIHADIGLFLKQRMAEHFKALGQPLNVRYIDPSYTIRGLAANTDDAVLCDMLARNAVHAAMAGRSGLIVGSIHNRFIHVPMELATAGRKQVALGGEMWQAVQAVTGQPSRWE